MKFSAFQTPRFGRSLLYCAFIVAPLAWHPAAHADERIDEVRRVLERGDAARAANLAARHLRAQSDNAPLRLLHGIALLQAGLNAEARDVFMRMTHEFPNLPEPWNNLAVIHAREGRLDLARDALERAIRTHPSYATAHDNLGEVYASLASQAYDKALQISSGQRANGIPAIELAMLGEIGSAPTTPLRLAQASVAAPVAPRPGQGRGGRSAQEDVPEPPSMPAPAAAPATPAPATPAVPAAAAPAVPPPLVASTPAAAGTPAPTAPAASASASAPPAPAPSAAGSAESAAAQAAVATAQRWAADWAAQNVPAYLAHYDQSFAPPRGASRNAWAEERRQRIRAPRSIQITLENPQATLKDGGTRAEVSFVQRYRASNFNSNAHKVLELVLRDGKWRIVREQVQ